MRIYEFITEAPLPPDWNPMVFQQGKSTFKQRLDYALQQAEKLGTGSTRIVMTIEYQGRPTALKIAKNNKGLEQNKLEVSVLTSSAAKQMNIVIPIIDYDKKNENPFWVQTELAQKATKKQLCSLMRCDSLHELVSMAYSILGQQGYPRGYYLKASEIQKNIKKQGRSDQDIKIFTKYAQRLANLKNYYNLALGDFERKENWGIYQGRPILIDLGFIQR